MMAPVRKRSSKPLVLREGLLRLYRMLPGAVRGWVARTRGARMGAKMAFDKTPAWSVPVATGQHAVRPEAAPTSDSVGVNLFGFFRGQFGLGESARLYAQALIGAGVPVAVHDIDLGLPHGWNDHSLDPWMTEDAPYPISIVFINPDVLEQALDHIGQQRLQGRYLIGCWFWELEQIPEQWLSSLALIDEIMVASAFVEQVFRTVTDKPITCIPLPVGEIHDSGLQRQDFGLDEGKFIFLSSFDFNSHVMRKNPLGAMQAFTRAFAPERDDVRLLVKSSNGFRLPGALSELRAAARTDRRIIMRDDIIERTHMAALQRCCDAYVSLHRAEGFGLGLAECMAQGKPVVATNWSGNLEFMQADTSILVDYRLVPVQAGEYPYVERARWAEPSIADAAIALRTLADDPAGAVALGARGAAAVRRQLAPEVVGGLLARRIHELQDNKAILHKGAWSEGYPCRH